jgi:glycosyltransferase involved in cell wall biosynthesis
MSKPGTVLFSDYNPSRSNGGEELVLREALLGLAARGWRCLLAYHEWGDLIPEYEAAGVVCRRFDLTPAERRRPWRFALSVVQQAMWVRRERAQLYYCNSYFRATHAGAVKRLGMVPALCQFHLPAPEYLSRQYRWGLDQLDGFVAVSACTAAEWSRLLGVPPERIDVLHNPVDIARFRPDESARASARREIAAADDCVVIGYCGRLVTEKGVDVLLRAAARLVTHGHPVKLVIVGSDAQNVILYGERLEPQLKALAQDLGIADRVEFVGPRIDVERWYNAIDVLAVPSVVPEGFGLVVAEALASSRPVVASRIGGIPEIMAGALGEWLVPPGDVDALAAALQRLVGDPLRRAEMGRLGRRTVEQKFNLTLFLDRLEQFLQKLLSPAANRVAAAE